MYKLRPYQSDVSALKRKVALEEIAKGNKFPKILIVMPTRSGKTVEFSDTAARVIKDRFDKNGNKLKDKNGDEIPNKRVLIIVHRSTIFGQTVNKLSDYKIPAGQIASGKSLTKNLVQVAMIGTLRNLLKKQIKLKENGKFKDYFFVEPPDLIIIDEAHHACSKTWQWVMAYYKNVMQLGYTATPIRLDNKPMGDVFDRLVIGKSMRWMIENHWISNYKHFFPPSPLKDIKLVKKGKDYEVDKQVKNLTTITAGANIIKWYKYFLDGAQVIVYCCNKKHAKLVKELFENAGYPAQSLDSDDKNRTEILNKYESGECPILTSIDIVSEGFDVPVCSGVIFLSKTMSLCKYQQQGSRGLTPIYDNLKSKENPNGYDILDDKQRKLALMAGKPFGFILDFVGNGHEHLQIDLPRKWSLEAVEKKKKKKGEVDSMECPCGFTYFKNEYKVCPICGHDFEAHKAHEKQIEIEELEGELVNIHYIIPESAESLAKTILDMKKHANKRNMMLSHLHQSINLGEKDIKKKVSAMCAGLEFSSKYKHIIWQQLLQKYPEKLLN